MWFIQEGKPLFVFLYIEGLYSCTPDLWSHLNEVITRYTYLRKGINLYEQITLHRPVFFLIGSLRTGPVRSLIIIGSLWPGRVRAWVRCAFFSIIGTYVYNIICVCTYTSRTSKPLLYTGDHNIICSYIYIHIMYDVCV